MVHEYELTVIIRPDIDDAASKATIERVEKAIAETGGELLDADDWGTRKLAYMIDKHARGQYVLFSVVSEPAAILEIERRLRLADTVIRFLSIKIGEAVDLEARRSEAAAVRQEREEARARAEAAAAERESMNQAAKPLDDSKSKDEKSKDEKSEDEGKDDKPSEPAPASAD